MLLKLPYGKEELDVSLSSDRVLEMITPSEVTPAPDPLLEVERALASPIGASTVQELAPRGKKVAIAVDDITRTTPTSLLLTPLLKQLVAAGASRDRIKIFTALGTHRPMTESEMREKYGSEVYDEHSFINHAFDDESQLKYMGVVEGDVPVWINKEFIESDIRVVTGNIIPHFNAGWAAGAKILLPGLAGEETVGRMHVHSALTTPNGLGVEDNPTRRLIDAFGERARIHLMLNSVITRHKEVVKAYAGHFIKAHRRGVEEAKRVYSVGIKGLADITLSSSYPCDIEYWQGLKGLFSADLATRDGGGIIEVTPCPEGISVMHPKWIEYLQHDTEELREMYQGGEVEDYVALGLAINIAHVRERHPICIISQGISYREADKMGFQKFKEVEEAIDVLTRRYGSNSKINVLTHGGETYPTLS